MQVMVSPSTWTDDDHGEVSGVIVHVIFKDDAKVLDLDEREGLDRHIEPVVITGEAEETHPRLIRRNAKIRKEKEKEAQQRAYMKRQEEVRLGVESYVDQVLDERDDVDLALFAGGETISFSKNRKTRKVKVTRRYRNKP